MNWQDHILYGPKPLYATEKGTAGQQLYRALSAHAKSPNLLINANNGEALTYKQLLETTCRLAQALENAGLIQNDVISVCSDNNLFFFYPVIAALYLGIVVAPINQNYTERELHNCLNISKPKIIFCSKHCVNKILSLQSRLTFIQKVIVLDSIQDYKHCESLSNFLNRNSDVNMNLTIFSLHHFNNEQIACILSSSGTTGLPKGVMLTHKNLVTRFAHCQDSNIAIGYNINPGNSVLTFMPFFHSFGFGTTLEYLIRGFNIVMIQRFDNELLLKSIQKYKVESMIVVPPILIFLAKSPLVDKYNLSTIKEIGVGAAPLSKSIQDAVMKRLNLKSIRQAYGLTETTLAVTMTPKNDFKIGSSGKLVPYLSARVVDPDTQRTLGRNKTGELHFKGDLIAIGYAGNKEATEATFDKDGWLKTGDIGYFDEDGHVYVVGRIKELIKYKGYQVPPAELEKILLEHASIKDAAVIGIPDDEAGELPSALVVLQPGKHLTEKEVQDYIAGQVSSQKRLRGGVLFMNEIPKSATGKFERKKLLEMTLKFKSKM